jgi:signal transduction histidine kinase
VNILNSLFRKYVVALVALVTCTLLISGLTEIYFSHQEHRAALLRIEYEKALVAASKIEQFTRGVEREVTTLARSPWAGRSMSAAERQFEFRRTLARLHAITEITRVDAAGREQLRVSRIALDAINSKADRSGSPAYAAARARGRYFSPVYFRMESEPYMTVAASSPDGGVVSAEVNLKLMWEVVSDIAVGRAGYAYAVDSNGRLIAHPDISLVLQKTELATLAQVNAARSALREPETAPERVSISRNLEGREVLTAHAAIPSLGWLVFVEQPVEESFAPLRTAVARGAAVLLLGLALAVLVSVLLARRMVAPIRHLQQGAARVGAGDFGHRIEVRTGDELEALAAEFNRAADRLRESHALLERKVEARTWELANANAHLTETLEQQTAIAEVLRVFSSSPTELQPVFELIAAKVAQLCRARFCAVFRCEAGWVHFVAAYGHTLEEQARMREFFPVAIAPDTAVGRAVLGRCVVAIPDVVTDTRYKFSQVVRELGGRSIVAVPMLRKEDATGAIVVGLEEPGAFPDAQITLLETFADQSVVAIENVRLFQELKARSEELSRSLGELRALGEVGRAVSASLDLPTVLTTIVTHAAELSSCDGGILYEFDDETQTFRVRAAYRVDPDDMAARRAMPIRLGVSAIGRAGLTRAPVEIPDLLDEAADVRPETRTLLSRRGIRSLVAVPIFRDQTVFGCLAVWRTEPGQFSDDVIRVLRTFAVQSVLAIEHARLFREIAAKNHELEITSQHKSQFLANMSHELRTPLNAIIGFSEVLLERMFGEMTAKQESYIRNIHASGRHLLSLINEILDLSKIEAGRMELHIESFAVAALVEEVAVTAGPLASKNANRMVVECAGEVGTMRADAKRMRQVLLNVVGNAAKFTERGLITIRAERRTEDGRDWILIVVSDTGIGMSREQMDRLFQDFVQADASTTRRYGGTGLGLAISRRFCRLMGGDITVDSEPGRGSDFTLRLPAAMDEAARPDGKSAEESRARRLPDRDREEASQR